MIVTHWYVFVILTPLWSTKKCATRTQRHKDHKVKSAEFYSLLLCSHHKQKLMKPYHSIVLFTLLNCFISLAQEEFEFEDEVIIWTEGQDGKYVKSTSDKEIRKKKNITVLITECGRNTDGLFKSIKNNPQLLELQLTHVDQELLNKIFNLSDSKLQTIIIDDFQGRSCLIPVCKIPSMNQLNIESEQAITIEFSPNTLSALEILDVRMDNLNEWKGNLAFDSLALIDIHAPLLKKLPPLQLPQLYQCMMITSAPFPLELCDMPELMHLYISTTIGDKLSPCHEELLKRKGLLEFEIFSDDPEKTQTFESQESIDFEKQMEEENKRMQEGQQKE